MDYPVLNWLSHSCARAPVTHKERKKERVRVIASARKEGGVLRRRERKKEKKRKVSTRQKRTTTTRAFGIGHTSSSSSLYTNSTKKKRKRERERERDKRRVRCQLQDHDSRNESSETRRDESRVREKATRLMCGERGVASGVDSRGRDRPRERCVRATEAAEAEGILR